MARGMTIKTLKTKELWKENEAKNIEDLIKRKMKEETGLRDKHFIIIYIHIIIVIIINSSSSNDDTDGDWVEFGNTCWYQFVWFCLGKLNYWHLFEQQLLEGTWELKIFGHFVERDGVRYVCIIWDAVSTYEVQDLSFVTWNTAAENKSKNLLCI